MGQAFPTVRIRKGDEVMIMAGKDRGKRGKILQVVRPKARVVVEKLNLRKKHMRPTRETKGGIVEQEGPLAIANVMLICPHCGKPTRIGMKVLADGRRLRFCKRCEEVVDRG